MMATFEVRLARGVVEALAGVGVELEGGPEPADDAGVDGEQIKKARSVCFRLQADHLAAALRRGLGVDVVQIGRLSTEARTVVNDLRGHLHRRVIEEDHSARAPTPKGVDGSTRYFAVATMRAARSL